jgi:hypothetical protein
MTQHFRIHLLLLTSLVGSGVGVAHAQQQPLPNSTVPLCQEDCVRDCMGNDTPTERANCLNREKCYQRAPCPTKGSGASFSIDRATGQITVKCADSDSTRACVDAIGPIISPGGGSTTVVYATNSIKCGDTVYTVSTGTNTGSCVTGGTQGQPVTTVNCQDGGKQVSSASCSGGCGTTLNGGKCEIK